jgi:hypothetical protein
VGELERVVAEPRVHHERDDLPTARHPDVGELDAATFELDRALLLQLLDHRPAQARGGELVGQQRPAGLFFETIPERRHTVVEPEHLQRQQLARDLGLPHGRALLGRVGLADRVAVDLGAIVVDRSSPQTLVKFFARRGEEHVDRMRAAIE